MQSEAGRATTTGINQVRVAAMRSASFLLFALVLTPALEAQVQVRTETRVNLRADPSTSRPPLLVLPVLSELQVIGADSNGFRPVRTRKGRDGWVAREYVYEDEVSPFATLALRPPAPRNPTRVIGVDAPSDEIDESWEKPPMRKSTLYHQPNRTACGPRGKPGGDFETFLLKNRADTPTISYAVTFDALDALPYLNGGLAKDRGGASGWTDEERAEIARFEGIPITVTGFLAAMKPQGSGSEATNCGFGGEPNTDWHMAMVRGYRDVEANSMVVEPTPRIKRKHPNWRTSLLVDRVGDQRSRRDSVRITGFLFYDPDHANHLRKFRKSMWEIHPVTRIEIFLDGAWVDLDDVDQ